MCVLIALNARQLRALGVRNVRFQDETFSMCDVRDYFRVVCPGENHSHNNVYNVFRKCLAYLNVMNYYTRYFRFENSRDLGVPYTSKRFRVISHLYMFRFNFFFSLTENVFTVYFCFSIQIYVFDFFSFIFSNNIMFPMKSSITRLICLC